MQHLLKRFPFACALALSLFFHILLLCSFRITSWIPLFPSSEVTTPSITIESFDASSIISPSILFYETASSDAFSPFPEHHPSIRALLSDSLFALSSPPHFESCANTTAPEETVQPLPPFLPWESIPSLTPSSFQLLAYPLRITLMYGIKELILTNDASDFFSTATPQSIFLTSQFCSVKPTVHFSVQVDMATGMISSSSCPKELVDKQLQELACAMLSSLRFKNPMPCAKETASGMVEMQFHGTFDAIAPYLKKSAAQEKKSSGKPKLRWFY